MCNPNVVLPVNVTAAGRSLDSPNPTPILLLTASLSQASNLLISLIDHIVAVFWVKLSQFEPPEKKKHFWSYKIVLILNVSNIS